MKKLIVISGDLAAGKSTLATGLANKYTFPLFMKDPIKELLCDQIGFKNREENRKLSRAAVAEMIHIFEELAPSGSDIILESNFRSEELSKIYKISTKYGYQACLLLLIGDKELIYKRFVERAPTRHRAHMSLRLDQSFEKFSEYIEELRKGDFVFPIHKIDVTNLSKEEVLEKAEEYLRNSNII